MLTWVGIKRNGDIICVLDNIVTVGHFVYLGVNIDNRSNFEKYRWYNR